ncbi:MULTISPECIES: acetylornithine transaminase [unclassified Campylobacter]|uniref:acetylornithine transaminase n=1 Tax=unclassified Campylobacter TaxID=2593542 RepID=UPI0014748EF1|nr:MULTISPECIES: acetylornithine transaminase [unclassified Campylobacter]
MYLLNTYARFDFGFERGEDSVLFDAKGRDYIDFASGIGVNSLGYAHKRVVKTISEQADKILHSSNIYRIKPQEKLAKQISKMLGFKTFSFFCNSGAEANECAIKLARKYGATNFKEKKFEIISLANSFHGRTLATLKLTGQDKFHPEIYAPYIDGFKFYGSISEIIENISEKTVAVMIELVQGEGGINALDKSEAKRLAKVLKEKDLLLITDEVQCGVFRTGEFVTSKLYGIKPDIITFAKGLGAGVPIGACVSKKEIFEPGDHGSTFGGNFLATATALTALDELKKLKKSGKIDKQIEIFNENLDELCTKFPKIIKQKEGLGLMLGLVLHEGVNLADIIKLAAKNRVLVLKSGTSTLRFLPPLNMKKSEIKEGFKRLQKALSEYKI